MGRHEAMGSETATVSAAKKRKNGHRKIQGHTNWEHNRGLTTFKSAPRVSTVVLSPSWLGKSLTMIPAVALPVPGFCCMGGTPVQGKDSQLFTACPSRSANSITALERCCATMWVWASEKFERTFYFGRDLETGTDTWDVMVQGSSVDWSSTKELKRPQILTWGEGLCSGRAQS
ncbi:hypothetical protein FA13DRAFT_1712488 [Coprinellus micaceus]|uniref:Uncharacterized protein n=1 Tax=Coprinellus micaceus TaxID=71717 RepID=A0A4Y7T0B9_COPMI|nr:hypothetical protein FA13DRAFT_1712488 [Coprinellus micaceus]